MFPCLRHFYPFTSPRHHPHCNFSWIMNDIFHTAEKEARRVVFPRFDEPFCLIFWDGNFFQTFPGLFDFLPIIFNDRGMSLITTVPWIHNTNRSSGIYQILSRYLTNILCVNFCVYFMFLFTNLIHIYLLLCVQMCVQMYLKRIFYFINTYPQFFLFD